jgi:hypothetical protein
MIRAAESAGFVLWNLFATHIAGLDRVTAMRREFDSVAFYTNFSTANHPEIAP